ncbi:MAG: hypothetical protein JO149_09855 [Gammaproteobacteria bacterium]|nr:hypothetical protein [Gammaproteobacteria bacterium]
MKKGILLSFVTALFLLSSSAQANVSIDLGSADACSNIIGSWAGTATLSNPVINCQYNGTGNIGSVDENGNFGLDIHANKISGIFCPNTYADHLAGVCKDGNVSINTGHGDLRGTFSGATGNANGTLSILGIQVAMEILFNKTFLK